MLRFIYIVVFIFDCLIVASQSSPLKIKKITTYQGLSNSAINSIAQDTSGFMWFATEDGLNKFDGYRFSVYKFDYSDTFSVSGNFISDLCRVPGTDQLWIATSEGLNLYDYENDRFIRFTSRKDNPGSINNNVITRLAASGDGNLWVGTYGGGVSYFDRNTFHFTHIHNVKGSWQNFNHNKVVSLLEDSWGVVWIGSQDSGLDIYDPKQNRTTHFSSSDPAGFPSDCINAIFEDRDHNMWIGTNNGLALFDRDKKSFIVFRQSNSGISSNIIKTLYQDHSGIIWIGTQAGGICKFDPAVETIRIPSQVSFEVISESNEEKGLSYSTVHAIYEDRDKNIWIGTYTGGINLISNLPSNFRNLSYRKNDPSALNFHKVWGICDDLDGDIWIGTDGGGINRFNPKTGRIKIYRHADGNPLSLSDNAILCALKDHSGNLWFGTYAGGLNKYDKHTNGFVHYRHKSDDKSTIAYDDIRVIYEDLHSNLWIGTNSGGLSRFLPSTGKFINYNVGEYGTSGNSVLSILQDKVNGNYWIGTKNGLQSLDKNLKRLYHFVNRAGDATSIGNNTVYTIVQDHHNRIWIGTKGGGISLFEPETGKFINYGEKEGLANSVVKAILEDNRGNLWLSTDMGISRFSPDKKLFVNYDIYDGILPGEFSDGSALFSGNTMYFGNMNGLVSLNPGNIEDNIMQPVVRIVDLQVFNRSTRIRSKENADSPLLKNITLTKEIAFNSKQSVFTIEFVAINYKSPEKTSYSYIMEGIDNEWNFSGSNRFATYRNLPPGKYTFKVKATNVKGIWGDSVTTLDIIVKPPFWKTWWARLIYAVILFSIGGLIYRYYSIQAKLERNLVYEKITRQKEHQLNQEKIRFFTNITHEFRSPLTLIIGPLEDLLREKNMAPGIIRRLLLMYRNSNRLLELIDKLLEFRKVETGAMKLKIARGNIVGTVKEVCFPFRELFAEKSIRFSVETEIDEAMFWYDTEKIFIILNNLLSNAFKYTPDHGEVKVVVQQNITNDCILIKVIDSGVGISASHLGNIFDQYYRIEEVKGAKGSGIGLALTKNLVELHHGKIWVESEEGKGSCFIVQLCSGKDQFSPDQLIQSPAENFTPSGPKTDLTKISEAPQHEVYDNDQNPIMLVVEDNDEIRSYICDSFADEYRILEAPNGKQGLDEAFKVLPDIIITDIMMPDTNGLELCSILKNNIKTSHIPIVMLTARNSLQQKQEGYESGADSYVTKPFSMALLKTRVSNLLLARKRLAEHMARSVMLQPEEIQIGLKDEKFIADAIGIIEKNISEEDFDVDFLAGELNLSHSALYRKIKALTGFNITEFIRGIRLKNAAQLLRTKEFTVSEVAYKVGFNDLKYFRQAFREQFKVSPSDYMKSETMQE